MKPTRWQHLPRKNQIWTDSFLLDRSFLSKRSAVSTFKWMSNPTLVFPTFESMAISMKSNPLICIPMMRRTRCIVTGCRGMRSSTLVENGTKKRKCDRLGCFATTRGSAVLCFNRAYRLLVHKKKPGLCIFCSGNDGFCKRPKSHIKCTVCLKYFYIKN